LYLRSYNQEVKLKYSIKSKAQDLEQGTKFRHQDERAAPKKKAKKENKSITKLSSGPKTG